MNALQVRSAAAEAHLPMSADWHGCAADLAGKQTANEAERAGIATERQSLALAAATGDASARKRLARLAARERSLDLDAASIEHGLALAREGIAAADAQRATEARQHAIAEHNERLEERLEVVAKIEQAVRDIVPLLDALDDLGSRIAASHAALGGKRPLLPPLAQEAVGGRLAEFLAGIGFADWLPVTRPEIRPAIASWNAAEDAAQAGYRMTD
jgi:hypothetical protein